MQQILNQLKIGNIVYDLAAKYDSDGDNIKDTYFKKDEMPQIEQAVTEAENVNATITEGNIFEVTDRTGTKKSLDISGLVSAQDAIDELQKQDVTLKSNIDSNFETINNKVDEIKTATDSKIDAADVNLQDQITSNDSDITNLTNTLKEQVSRYKEK